MPFTPAHAAAALPLLRLRLVPSALVVGTMAPDFEYFLRFAPGGGFGHTVLGAFLLSLPLALIVLWIFHALLKTALVQLFPDGIRLRIQTQIIPFRFGPPSRFLLIVVSALVGIATHLVWDLFTHRDTWPYRHFAWLREEVHVPVLGLAARFGILQLGSSAAGILLLCGWLLHWYRATLPIPADSVTGLPAARRYWILAGIAAIAAAGGGIRAWTEMVVRGERGWVIIAGDSVSTAIALAWWTLVLYAIVPLRRWSRLET